MVIRPGDAGGHLDPLEVAEHAEGLLTPERSTAVDAHLSSCAQCRELSASVVGVTTALAAAPRELPIPDGVAARIDAALAEEARTAVSEPARAEGFWAGLRGRLPVIAAAAASVAVLGLIGYSLAGTGGGDDAATTSDAGAGIAESDDAPESARAPMDAPDEAEEEAGEDERADLDDSGDAADSGEAEGDDGEQAENDGEAFDGEVSVREREALVDELQDVLAQQSAEAEPGADGEPCGTVLAEELGGERLGAADTDLVEPDSVLVAIDLDDPDTLSGWVLPGCTAGPDDAAFDFVVPRPE
jgi:hypothetical protein